MSTWYFENAEKRTQLIWEADGWVGTPFRFKAMVKGVGVDCVHLAAALYIATGFLESFKPPRYSLEESMHSGVTKVIDWIELSGRFRQLPAPTPGELMPGDLLLFRIGKVEHHVGVAIGRDYFLHVICHHVAGMSNLTDPSWRERMTRIYRPLASAKTN